MQDSMNWSGILTSAIASEVGSEVKGDMRDALQGSGLTDGTIRAISSGASTFANFGTTALLTGGNLDPTHLITSAVQDWSGDTLRAGGTQGVGAYSASDYTNAMDQASDNYSPVFAADYVNAMDMASDNYNPAFGFDYRNGSDMQSDNYNPASAYGYRNGSDMQSDNYIPASASNYRNGSDIQSDKYVARVQQALARLNAAARNNNPFYGNEGRGSIAPQSNGFASLNGPQDALAQFRNMPSSLQLTQEQPGLLARTGAALQLSGKGLWNTGVSAFAGAFGAITTAAYDRQAGVDAVQKITGALSLESNSPAERQLTNSMHTVVGSKINAFKVGMGDNAYESSGSPLMATAAYMTPEIAAAFVGVSGARVMASELRGMGVPDFNVRLSAPGELYTGSIGLSLERVGANEGPQLFQVANHGDMPSPRPGLNSHHGVMSAWMDANFPGYDANLAPAVLMPEVNHRATFGVYNRWRVDMKAEQGGTFDWSKVPENSARALSDRMFDASKTPDVIRQEYWQKYDAMKGKLE